MEFKEVYNRLSICTVDRSAFDDGVVLNRKADIINGEIIKPLIIEDSPKKFENRTTLYRIDGPSVEGSVGVWSWTAIENRNDSEKDYVVTKYDSRTTPIEFIALDDVNTSDSVIECIKNGIDIDKPIGDLLVGRNIGNNYYEAIYLKAQSITEKGNKITVTADTTKVPFYKIHIDDIVSIGEIYFFRKMKIDLEVYGEYNIRKPAEVVKDIVLDKISWSNMKTQGYSRDQYKKIKDYIDSIDVTSLTKSIQEKLGCSETKAKEYLEEFKMNGSGYLIGHSSIDKIIESLIERDENLSTKLENIAEQKWIESHLQKVTLSNRELDVIKKEKEKVQSELFEIEKSVNSSKKELQAIKEEINRKSLFGDEVKDVIDTKISEARANLSRFIGEVEYLRVLNTDNAQYSNNEKFSQIVTGTELKNNADLCYTFKETLETLYYELQEAGVTEKDLDSFSKFLYSCYFNRFPLLLAGPSSFEIACAFSASIEHKFPTTIECREGFSFPKIIDSNTETVVVRFPFVSGIREDLLEMITNNKYFYILCTPYSDDLSVEPVGLFNYMLPVVTDFFVDKKPTSNFHGGKKADKYTDFSKESISSHKYLKTFRKLGAGSYFTNICEMIADDCRTMKVSNEDFMYKYIMLSLAHITGRIGVLKEVIKDSGATKDLKDLIFVLAGD